MGAIAGFFFQERRDQHINFFYLRLEFMLKIQQGDATTELRDYFCSEHEQVFVFMKPLKHQP